MRQDKIREELKFIIDSVGRMNKNFNTLIEDRSLHPNTIKVVGALKEYFGPLGDHLLRVHNSLVLEFTDSNLENGHLRELLRKQCECEYVAVDPLSKCEGCKYLEQLEEKEILDSLRRKKNG